MYKYKQDPKAAKAELIDALETKPPRTFKQIRRTLRQTMKIVRAEVARIEKEFIDDKRDLSQEIKTWVVPLKAVILGAKVSELSSTRVIDGIFAKAATPGITIPVDPMDLVRLKDCVMKVREYVPFKFNRAVELIQKSLKILQKYCLSFYDMVNDPPLGTAYDYHSTSIGVADKVKILLEKCRLMSFKFQTEVLTLRSDFFGTNARQIAARCECENMPFLVMFPQVCDNLREIASLLEHWVTADENYADYIRHDVDDIEKKRQELVRRTRDLKDHCYHLQYKLKLAQQEEVQNLTSLTEWKGKSSELIVEEELTLRELNDKKVDLEIKEFKKAELVRNSDTLEQTVYQEQLDSQTLQIKKARDEVKVIAKKLENIQLKLNRCEERQDILVAKNNISAQIQLELDQADQQRQEAETEMAAILNQLQLAKRIYLHKTSAEMLQKIYYSVPLEPKSPRHSSNDESAIFDRACRAVAEIITNDWTRLYRLLPFIPARGKHNIETDIETIVQTNPRDSSSHHALRALNRWRRFNTRAKTDDLISALKRLRRFDIVHEVDFIVNPPLIHTKTDESPPPSFLAHYLIPCYKEVEKYDQLRAANRIPPFGWEHTRLIL